ncbi:Structural maintenance of chromosomes protein 2 [Conglomerata obtusa]
MQITEIKIKGFKSFSSTVHLKNLTPFTSITGLNGLGKSNILDSVIFCLHLDTHKQLRIKKLEDLINSASEEAIVTVTFSNINNLNSAYKENSKNSETSGMRKMVIERSISRDGRSRSTINNHPCTSQSLKNMLSEHGITKNAQNVILQGNITKVLEINRNFKKFVQETAGIRCYEEEKSHALETLESKENKLCAAKESLKRRIEPFVSRMREERQNYIEQKRCEENKDIYEKKFQDLQEVLNTSTENKKIVELKKIINKYKSIKQELEEEKNKIVEEEIGDNLDLLKKIEENQKLIILTVNEIKNMQGEVEIDIEKENKPNKRKKKNSLIDFEELEKKYQALKTKETFILNEIKQEERINAGFKNNFNFQEKTKELEKNKMKKMELETKLKNFNINIEQKIDLDKINFIENIKYDETKLNHLKEEIERIKNKIEYPLINGVYGTVFENFEIKNEKYKEAIDVILGGRSNYIIVDDEKIGEEIIRKGTTKRINVIPLNKIKSNFDIKKTKSIKNLQGVNAIELLTFDHKLRPAIEFIFGSYYVFESKENAKNACYKFNISCVTLDGNTYDPRGIVTGGKRKHYNEQIIKKKVYEDLEKSLHEMESKRREYMKYSDEYKILKKQQEEYIECNKLKNELFQAQNNIELIENALKNKKVNFENELLHCKKEIDKLDDIFMIRNNELKEQQMKEAKNKQKEIEFINLINKKNNLEIEREEFQKLLRDYENKQEEFGQFKNEQKLIEEKIKILISALSKNKLAFKKIVESILINNNKPTQFSNTIPLELRDVSDKIKYLQVNFNEEINLLSEEQEEKYQLELMKLKKDIENVKKNTKTKMDPKNFELLEKNEETIKQLEEKIIKLENDKIKILNNINDLTLESENEVKKAFIHLNKETGAFLRTFINDSDLKLNDDFEINVKIGTWKESLGELSGGQRSIVALCLIFAMLTYKPASFYIFDEIDSALDLSFTQSIGENIRKKFNNAQFIVVSLKEGLFENADSIFQVFLNEGKSDVRKIK